MMQTGAESMSPPPSDLLEVGRVGKAHGVAGEVLVDFVTDRVAERTAPGAVLRIGDGTLEVVSARPHKGKWIVRFVGVDDRSGADALRGALLRAEPIDDPEALFVHQLIGCRLVDQVGTDHGPVVAVVANPASDLLELDDGRLVPLTFLVDRADGEIRVEVPPGLLDADS
jgi:16S rRNA processing protein RimM